jgi:hypothetical protein
MRAFSTRFTRLVVALTVGALASGCESTPGFGTRGKVVVRSEKTTVAVVFSEGDRRLITEHYAGRKKSLPPGLAKGKRLPPGLEKQVVKNGTLPPGLQRRMLPRELEAKLSKLPEGYVRVIIGTDIVLEDTRTRIAVDVIKDIAY